MKAFKLNLPSVDSVALDNLKVDANGFLKIDLEIFRVENVFNHSEVSKIDSTLSNQNFNPPTEFGPFSFVGDTSNALDGSLYGTFLLLQACRNEKIFVLRNFLSVFYV